MNKKVFEEVAEAYRTIIGTGVKLGAQDYSRNIGGQGAQYDPHRGLKEFAYIDYTIDVDNILDKYLASGDHNEIRRRWFVGAEPDDDIQSEECLVDQYRIGFLFKKSGLYPTNKYFQTVKQ